MDKIILKNTNILVTGGHGYLGSHLVAALQKEGANVFIMSRTRGKDANSFAVDLTDRKSVEVVIKKVQPEIIFHLAASLNRERNFRHYHEINDINHYGTLNLLLALKDIAYQNFIYVSTSEIYGNNQAPFQENQIPDPTSPYSLTKLFAENLIKTFSKIYGKPFSILRLFNFFGKDMPANFFIPQMIHSLQNEITFEMTEGAQIRDFLYVEDVIQALLLSATNAKAQNETFNVCSGIAVSLKQLVSICKTKIKSDCKVQFGALPYRENEVWNMVGNNLKIKDLLNFKVKYDLETAIEETLTN